MASDSKIGKIKAIFCKNFLIYDECTLQPTEYLNIIIGPNGTGKSTLVDAIVIGLGGDPKLLNRSLHIRDFIKNGKEEATVAVSIYSDNDIVIFQRSFTRDKSEFRVNNNVLSRERFLKVVEQYNIQINNACQFLPQNKVQDFAKMNAQEVFINTLKSVCEQSVVDTYTKLTELANEQANGQTDITKEIEKLSELTTQVNICKQIVERYQAHKAICEKLKASTAKKLWLQANALKETFSDLKTKLNEAEKIFKQQQMVCANLHKQATASKIQGKRLLATVNEKIKSLEEIWKKQQSVVNSIDELVSKIQELRDNYSRQKHQNQIVELDVRRETALLEINEQDLKNAMDEVHMNPLDIADQQQKFRSEMESFRDRTRCLITDRNAINTKLDEIYAGEIRFLKAKIERMKNIDQQKIEILKTNFEDVYKGMQWLTDNGHSLQGKVYQPICIEINVTHPNYLVQIENCVPTRDLIAFACDNKNDISLLIGELIQKRNLRINVVHVEPGDSLKYKPREPLENLREYGFTHYAIDLIKGPTPILNFLCSIYDLHNIPLANKEVSRFAEQIPNSIRHYLGGDGHYTSIVSRYSGERTITQNLLLRKNILASVNEEELHELEGQLRKLVKSSDTLKNERSNIETEIKDIEYKREETRKQKSLFDSKIKNLENMKNRVAMLKRKIERLQTEVIDLPSLKQNMYLEIRTHLRKILGLTKTKSAILQKYQNELVAKKMAAIEHSYYNTVIRNLFNQLDEATKREAETEKDKKDIDRKVKESAEACKTMITEAKAKTNNCAPNDANFPYKKEFAELTNNLDELNEYITDCAARVDCMVDTDQQVVEDYERMCAEIETMRQYIEGKRNSNAIISKEIQRIFIQWQPEIEAIINSLNDRFAKFMHSMNYAGEISLIRKGQHDFASYGINIMVQYRKESQLQTLNRFVQSGGERAVAIATYTLSLQHLSHVPFRCVDEINQGMDPQNERKIFEILIEETTKPNGSQYFFVTPKLLPNLVYHEKMTIHMVYNSESIEHGIRF